MAAQQRGSMPLLVSTYGTLESWMLPVKYMEPVGALFELGNRANKGGAPCALVGLIDSDLQRLQRNTRDNRAA
jgi:hypothetical protein